MQALDVCYYEEFLYTISISCINSTESDVNYTKSLKANNGQDGQRGIIVEEKLVNISWCIKSISTIEVDLNISDAIGDNIFSKQGKTLLIKPICMMHSFTRFSVRSKKIYKAYHGT